MKNCLNCNSSHDVGPYLACYAQKNAPRVNWDDVCKNWKSKHITNADRLNAMPIEEKAAFLALIELRSSSERDIIAELTKSYDKWLNWLEREVSDV